MTCAALAVFLFGFSPYTSSFRLFYQIGALIFAIVALQIFLKYASCNYVYKADANELKIFRITGKNSVCVCSLNYEESLDTAHPASYYAEHPDKAPKTKIALNFCKTLFPVDYAVYYFNFNGKTASLKFEPDKVFLEHFNKKICEALENAKSKDNEEQDDE